MKTKITLWHNPKCSKSRNTATLLAEKDLDVNVIKYLETPPSKAELLSILQMLNMKPRELMRTKEDIYKTLNLKEETDDEKLISAMLCHPKLIERPIIIKGNKAVIGRPIENVESLLAE